MKVHLRSLLFFLLYTLHIYAVGTKPSSTFTENKGQIVDSEQKLRNDILFYTQTGNTDVYIRNSGFSYVIANRSKRPDVSETTIAGDKLENYSDTYLRIDADFLNTNNNSVVE